jgi:hypothetical protein
VKKNICAISRSYETIQFYKRAFLTFYLMYVEKNIASHSIFGKIAPLHLSLSHVQHSHTNVARDLHSS